MNLVLIGYRGTGKSTVGKILARKLGRTVVSTDAEIVKRANLSVPEIVKQFGWDHFRDVESAVCRDVAAQDQLIIDTGGGAILRPENVEALRKTGTLIWLTATVETITRRIGGDTQRPSLTGTKSFTDEIREVLSERTPKYQAAATHVVQTDGVSSAQVADRILQLTSGQAGR
ncbi:MAG: shikimate kinase [Nitrospira sp.]|uniref:Shikimate kinase n=1 Tax=Nitrospira defluvii TaxID=330214 RepID=A0ABN7KPB7_9BACT|nr:shikimate kinase [Nitrospira defluvii]MCS6325831.1 shikimate kinase [Nitrospira sp.]CAE6703601.1 Shikimate kinase [Nitrospira defluvii]